jgi:phosphoglycerol transferase
VTSRSSAWWSYAGVAAGSLAIVTVLMELWRADLAIPLTYRSEALFNALVVKATLDHGWPLDVPELGAPGHLDLRDLPLGDNTLHLLVIRWLGLVSPHYAVVMNLFYLLTFPLVAVSAFHVFRRFGVGTLPAVWGSLLYPFLAFHLHRGQHHLFLSAYHVVPLAVMVALWIASGAVALVDSRSGRWAWAWCRGKLVGSAVVCVLLAGSGVYYAFFAGFFFVIAGARAALRGRDVRHLALPLALTVLIVAVLGANYWPNIRYLRDHGATRLVARDAIDAETLGLKLWHLLTPVTDHRLAPVARLKEDLTTGRLHNEAEDAALGVVASVGFLTLLAWLLVPGREEEGALAVMDDLSVLNVSGVLLATVGGLGALVALLVPQMRAYNRISIYLAFFALFAVVVLIDRLEGRLGARRRVALALGLGVALAIGLYDQTSERTRPRHGALAAEYRSDAAFFGALTRTFPPGAAIFQLPAMALPEHPPIHRMRDYDHARGYLHAGAALRWSYGAMRGRESEAWQAWAAAQPAPALLDTLAAAGFSGLYVNREGYADGGTRLAGDITAALGQPPSSHGHSRLLVFDLRPHAEALRARVTPAEWEARQDAARHPVLAVWEHGCLDLEGTPERNWRWCSEAGEWRLGHGGRGPRRVRLDMSLAAGHEGILRLDGPFLAGEVRVGPVWQPWSQTVSIPPGHHTIRFRCDAKPVRPPGDPRQLVFRVHDFRVRPAE